MIKIVSAGGLMNRSTEYDISDDWRSCRLADIIRRFEAITSGCGKFNGSQISLSESRNQLRPLFEGLTGELLSIAEKRQHQKQPAPNVATSSCFFSTGWETSFIGSSLDVGLLWDDQHPHDSSSTKSTLCLCLRVKVIPSKKEIDGNTPY